MLVLALDAALVATECDAQRLKVIAPQIDALEPSSIAHVASVASLARSTERCTAFRSRWLLEHPQ